MLGLLAAVLFQALPLPATPRIASDLRAGMQLVYSSGDQLQAPWVVEAVDAPAPLKPGADCARVSIRRQPSAPAAETRLCVEGGMVHGFDAAKNTWVAQRPVGPNMRLEIPGTTGSVRYETGAVADAVVGALRLRAVETTVSTLDASGAIIRRLRERYAVSLTTAVGGTFEVPDAAAPGGWRPQQVFELREIRLP
jgi:hypothetical protein